MLVMKEGQCGTVIFHVEHNSLFLVPTDAVSNLTPALETALADHLAERAGRPSTPDLGIPSNLAFEFSRICNMRCSYCCNSFVSEDSSSNILMEDPERALRIVDEFVALGIDRSIDISFFGGEPLLYPKFIDSIVKHIATQYSDVDCNFKINTNGTILPNKILDILRSETMSLLVSVDGPQLIHDRYRRFPNGLGTHSRITRNIERLALQGIQVAGLLCVLNPHSLGSLNELVAFASKFSIPSVGISLPNFDSEARSVFDLPDAPATLVAAFVTAIQAGVNLHFSNWPILSFGTAAPCRGASGGSLFVACDGMIRPCQSLSIPLANFTDGLNAAVRSEEYLSLVQRDPRQIVTCSKCRIRAFCLGGCAVDHLFGSGNLSGGQDEAFCQFARAFFDSYIDGVLDGRIVVGDNP
jgi:radical SAM protein with 4Fe4S-binding SPASM domain